MTAAIHKGRSLENHEEDDNVVYTRKKEKVRKPLDEVQQII